MNGQGNRKKGKWKERQEKLLSVAYIDNNGLGVDSLAELRIFAKRKNPQSFWLVKQLRKDKVHGKRAILGYMNITNK